jgi:hypothetical protein
LAMVEKEIDELEAAYSAHLRENAARRLERWNNLKAFVDELKCQYIAVDHYITEKETEGWFAVIDKPFYNEICHISVTSENYLLNSCEPGGLKYSTDFSHESFDIWREQALSIIVNVVAKIRAGCYDFRDWRDECSDSKPKVR